MPIRSVLFQHPRQAALAAAKSFVVALLCAVHVGDSACAEEAPAAADERVTLMQPGGPTCDIDVLQAGVPSFRILLPEHITAEDVSGNPVHDARVFVHLIQGDWNTREGKLNGTLKLGRDMAVTLVLEPAGGQIATTLTVTNLSKRALFNVRANICAGVSRLPDRAGWSNRNFIPPAVPLVREQQGKYWYEQATPAGLEAWTPGKGWAVMHRDPHDPRASKVQSYDTTEVKIDGLRACAVQSIDGRSLLFQAWDAPCFYLTPFHGNACMHLLPLVAKQLAGGQSATIHGMAGIFPGSRSELTAKLEKFLDRP